MPARHRTRPALAALVLLGLGPLLAGCGGDASDDGAEAGRATPSADPESTQCREDWAAVRDEVDDLLADADGGGSTPTPSDLRARWVTVTAQVDYYARTGSAGDCADTLERERATIASLQKFSELLAPYDVELALNGYTRDRTITSYARPSGREGRAAPTPQQVKAALADLERLAPQATAQQAAAWQQALVTDVADDAAQRKAVADLQVLSGESVAYRKAQQARALLQRAADTAD